LNRPSTSKLCAFTLLLGTTCAVALGKAAFWQATDAPALSGTYKVSGASRLSGREEFKITRVPDWSTIETVGELNEGHGSRMTKTRLELQKGKLSRYSSSVTIGTTQRDCTIEFGPDSARVKIQSGAEKTERTVEVSADAILLDNDIWAQYQLLLSRYDMAKKGVQNFTIFVPAGGLRVYNAQAEFEGTLLYRLHGQQVMANSFVIMLADAYEVDIVADGTGVPLKAERYFDNKKAVLQ
jgi:hypothetical protein